MNVYECVAAVSAEIAQTGIAKTRKNEQQGYKFRGIDEMYNALAPLLAKHKLVILPRILSREVVEHPTKSGGVLFYVTVEAEFDFISAIDSTKHTVRTFGEAMDSGDKATNKAMSAAYKYAAMQTFCIPTEGDNDADATTHEIAPRANGARAAAPPANVDTATGEEAPAGYHFIRGYQYNAPWHEAMLLDYDAQGGAVRISTKLKIGELLAQADADHIPVKVDITYKKNSSGQAYLNKLEMYKPKRTMSADDVREDMDDDSAIPF